MLRKWIHLAAGLSLLACASKTLAQAKPSGGGQQNPGGQQPSGQNAGGNNQNGSPGLTWPKDAWDNLTKLDSGLAEKGRPIFKLCYELDVTTGSLSSAPFVFKPVDVLDDTDPKAPPCLRTTDEKHPLLMRSILVVAIDARRVPIARIQSITLNLTTAAGQPLFPNPVRPSAGATSTSPAAGGGGKGGGVPAKTAIETTWGKVYYLVWPQELQGDVIPTVAVSLTYTPPVPGTPWQGNTIYPQGSIVIPNPVYPNGCAVQLPTCPIGKEAKKSPDNPTGCSVPLINTCPSGEEAKPSSANGHYFTARAGGISTNRPASAPQFDPTDFIPDGTVHWIDSGTLPPTGAPTTPNTQGASQTQGATPTWEPGTLYPAASTIFYVPTQRYYQAIHGGTSDSSHAPAFTIQSFDDGSNLKVWVDAGTTDPSGKTGSSAPQVWKPDNPYKAGEVIYDPVTARYFRAYTNFTSNKGTPPRFTLEAFQFNDLSPLVWTDVGTAAPAASPSTRLPTPTRKANYPYKIGDVVFQPASGHYYTAITNGTSGPEDIQNFPANRQNLVLDGNPTAETTTTVTEELMSHVTNADLPGEWKLKADPSAGAACTLPEGSIQGADYPDWRSGATYNFPNCIRDSNFGQIYQLNITQALGPYESGTDRPLFPPLPVKLPVIQWEDSGTTPPSLVAAGQPADQTASLNYTLPQVHPKYYYNLSSGIVVSSVHSKSFGWQTNSLPSGTTPGSYTPIQTGSSIIVDPVLFFTGYFWPMDAESPWRKKDLRPGFTFGLSLASPADNFYFGLNSEIMRNIQIVGGFTIAQTSSLSSRSTSTVNTSPPPTKQNFTPGGFIGVSYNILGFIQSLFGGGKG